MPERACGAVVETVSVAVPEPLATELGLNEQEGRGVTEGVIALQDRLTVPLKPFTGAIVIVEVADPPAGTVAGESDDAAIVKSGGGRIGLTVRLTDVSWLKDPEVPVIVTFEVPMGVAAEVLIVRVDEAGDAAGVTEPGTKAQLASAGRLAAAHVSVTALLKPWVAVTVTIDVPDCPPTTMVLAGA
ncbi:MAG: hypothetical protein WB755_15650, partial [Terriglobales bacterium]